MATPIVVLLVCLPLLRPLRHPGQSSVDEDLRLATISAFVEHQSGPEAYLPARMSIDDADIDIHRHVIRVDGHLYSDQPPMLAFLLSGPYWIMHFMGYHLRENSVLVPYILTLLGSTLPAAAVGGLVYRMARIFELRRQWRCALAAAVVFGTGLISYAVVLNAHVPAAALVMGSVGCVVHLLGSKNPNRGGGWIVLSGACAALAATIDLPAAVFLVLMLFVVAALPLSMPLRLGAVILYILGAAGPILLHATLMAPLTGDLLPGALHQRLLEYQPPAVVVTENDDPYADEDAPAPPGFWQRAGWGMDRLVAVLMGDHGLLVHFPAVLLGAAGMLAVMHRHWPVSIKALAAASAAAILLGLLAFVPIRQGTATAGFANRWLMVFLPILLFWAGAWLRRPHRPLIWAAAALLLAFSIIVSLIGTTDPMPRDGYNGYTALAAWHNMFNNPTPPPPPTAMAG
ncbi:MAG: hypothetical protein ABSG31_07155 [Tepidisphaeraceae bacterium]